MVGHPMGRPASTICGRGANQKLGASHLIKPRGTCRDGQPLDRPMPATTAGGTHLGEVRAFLLKYYGTANGQDLLIPRELFRAQGFPDRYVIEPVVNGRPLTKTARTRTAGNSVSPRNAEAVVRASVGKRAADRAAS